jgi:cytochrome c peroxidase
VVRRLIEYRPALMFPGSSTERDAMHRRVALTPGLFVATGLTIVMAGLAGCGGTGSNPPAVSKTIAEGISVEVKGEKATVVASTEGPQDKDKAAQSKPGEPASSGIKVDPTQAVDVVKGDVKGGESASGGTPEEFLYLSPDPSLIKDEPLTPTVPLGLQPLLAYTPASNPLTKGKVELGKQLYFDPRVSLDNTVSCATCHNPVKGWTDNLKTSVGIDGQVGGRNAPTVLNTVYGRTMFWDGRAPSLEGQSQGPPQNPIEMGKQSYKQIIERLRTIPGYREQFKKVFGTDVTLDGFAKAIAAFERVSALSGNSAYDKYTAGDMKALTESQKRGMVLFGLRLDIDDEYRPEVTLKKADCTSCHVGFNFSDEQFHNLGIGWNATEKRFADLGRFVINPVGAKSTADLGAFKTPTVRDIEKTAPYMHDGSLKTLEEVVDHYDKGGSPNPALDKDMKKLNLTAQEKADVVAFMKALTGERPKFSLPTLPPGHDGKAPNSADALAPPTKKTAWNNVVHPSPAF